MRNALAAEWRKLLGHTEAVSLLVWIYPIGAFVLIGLFGILPTLFIESIRDFTVANPPLWTDDLLAVWNAMNGFPGGTFLRMPFLAFIAMAFAGEYQWDTWKNILLHQSRTRLVLSKFLVLGLLMLLSLMLTSLVIAGGEWLTMLLIDQPYGPALADVDLRAFLQEGVMQIFVTFLGTLIVAAYTALIAMYSRSIIASLLLSVGISIVEFSFSLLLLTASQVLQRPHIVNAIVATPTYNLENVRSWVVDGSASTFGGFPGFTAEPTIWLSVAILLAWLAGLLWLTVVVFRRQDIT